MQDLAVDSTGDVIVIDSDGDPGTGGTSRIERFDSAGVWKATIGPVGQAATVGTVPDSDDVVIGGNQDGVDRNEAPTLRRFNSAGTDLGAIGTDASVLYATTSGIAVDDGPAGRLHVATDVSAGSYAGGYGLTSVQNYDLLTLATVNADPASDVAPFSATLRGTVNPEAAATTYHFEIFVDGGSSWTVVDQDGDGDETAGSGAAAVTVSESVTNLTNDTAYQFRLVAARGIARATSDAETFTTLPAPPSVTVLPAITGERTTKLRGAVNPRGRATTYHFEYGPDTSYGTRLPSVDAAVGDRTTPAVVQQDVDLAPSRTYHYRLVADNSVGTTFGDDQLLTTPADGARSPPTAVPTPRSASSSTPSTSRTVGRIS